MSDVKVELRKTNKARCRICNEYPTNTMVTLNGRWYDDRYYICQDCAKLVRDQLNDLNLSGKILPQPKVDKNKPEEEDLSNI